MTEKIAGSWHQLSGASGWMLFSGDISPEHHAYLTYTLCVSDKLPKAIWSSYHLPGCIYGILAKLPSGISGHWYL